MNRFQLIESGEGGVIAKLQEYRAQDLSESEQDRCFEHCATVVCKRILKKMIDRGLNIYHVVMDHFEESK